MHLKVRKSLAHCKVLAHDPNGVVLVDCVLRERVGGMICLDNTMDLVEQSLGTCVSRLEL